MKKYFFAALTIISITAAGWFAFANGYKQKAQKSNSFDEATLTLANTNNFNIDINDDEKDMLKELQELFAGVHATGSVFFMKGTIEATDPADSAQLESNTPFSFYNDGSTIFYELGAQQTVNTPTYYAVADHDLKRIVVAPAKILEAAQPKPLSLLGKNFKSEGYSIKKQLSGDTAVIQLLCENHISCKEIKVEFESSTKTPLLLYYRFTDLDNAEDKEFDKTISIHIREWQVGSDQVRNHAIPKMVNIGQESITAADGLEAYDIINLYRK